MTTKKKSLLGIGYLSVAMLGASLLMAKPVSAEEEASSQGASTVVTTQQASDTNGQQISQESQVALPEAIVEVGESTEDGERVLFNTKNPYQHGRDEGYNAGYKDGQKMGALEIPSNDAPEPQTIPYKDEDKKQDYSEGYRDNYYAGYRNGWDNNHYIWSTLRNVWYLVTSYFY
ncbi:FliH/SctL family protein [Streptococcus canis]|uniref:hypothetical protein n=1 Tax=Streptococcus canis TaxID=1329 RepID=UPI0013DA4E98|nr:hypothetical protein [Streptococcus canis]MDV5973179.1 hypothetical protein [Streptococcus canis]QKG78531.1 hypothetical protein GE021_010700 [Streptococcus canis]